MLSFLIQLVSAVILLLIYLLLLLKVSPTEKFLTII